MTTDRTIQGMLSVRLFVVLFVCLCVLIAPLAFAQDAGVTSDQAELQPSEVSADQADLSSDIESTEVAELSDEAEAPDLISKPERLSLSPVVLNEQAKPRDIIKRSLTVRNHSTSVMTLYADVYDVDPGAGAVRTSFGAAGDASRSLANWIEVTRGVIRIEPGGEVEIPYLIHVNLRAEPGEYFAEIVFREGRNRELAQNEPRSEAKLLASVRIGEDIVERINLGAFLLDRSIITGGSARFSYALQNSGNRDIEPRGSIRIYDRAGKEVASIPLNAGGDTIAPESARELAAEWAAQGRFGKYKAFLDVEYGLTGSVQDSLYFWVMPWRDMMIGLFLLLLAAGVITYLIHARSVYARPFAPVYVPATEPNEPPEAEQQPEYPSESYASLSYPEPPAPDSISADLSGNNGGRRSPEPGSAVVLSSRTRKPSSSHVVRLDKKT